MQPDPVADISTCDAPICTAHATLLQELATTLPDLIKTGHIRPVLEDMPIIDMTGMQYDADARIVERAFQLYTHFANVYVWGDHDNPAESLPAGVAVPLVQLAEFVDRPAGPDGTHSRTREWPDVLPLANPALARRYASAP